MKLKAIKHIPRTHNQIDINETTPKEVLQTNPIKNSAMQKTSTSTGKTETAPVKNTADTVTSIIEHNAVLKISTLISGRVHQNTA